MPWVHMKSGYRLKLPSGATAIYSTRGRHWVPDKWIGLLPEELYWPDKDGVADIPPEPEPEPASEPEVEHELSAEEADDFDNVIGPVNIGPLDPI